MPNNSDTNHLYTRDPLSDQDGVDVLSGPLLQGQKPFEALYLHIPFCKRRCLYCDFFAQEVFPSDSKIENYVDNMVLSFRRASRCGLLGDIKSVFIGGGTPSYIGNKQLSRLLYALSLSMHLTPDVECTLEANPDSLTQAMVKDLYALGVTRLSLGAQSFNDKELSTIGRIHSAQDIVRAVETARLRFENINLDLMVGLPGQTLESFDNSLHKALDLGVKHISVYPLAVEDKTPIKALFDQNFFSESLEVLDDMAALLMQHAHNVLSEKGMRHYEVSNYAYPGFECRHNLAYWSGLSYLGIGTSAVSMVENDNFRVRIKDNMIEDSLDGREKEIENLVLAMRRADGVEDSLIERLFRNHPRIYEVIQTLVDEGYITHCDNSYRPTEKGWLWGNRLYATLLELED